MSKHTTFMREAVALVVRSAKRGTGPFYWARPRRVFYANTTRQAAAIGFNDAYIYRELTKPNYRRDIKLERVIVPDALEAFDLWEQNLDKVPY